MLGSGEPHTRRTGGATLSGRHHSRLTVNLEDPAPGRWEQGRDCHPAYPRWEGGGGFAPGENNPTWSPTPSPSPLHMEEFLSIVLAGAYHMAGAPAPTISRVFGWFNLGFISQSPERERDRLRMTTLHGDDCSSWICFSWFSLIARGRQYRRCHATGRVAQAPQASKARMLDGPHWRRQHGSRAAPGRQRGGSACDERSRA